DGEEALDSQIEDRGSERGPAVLPKTHALDIVHERGRQARRRTSSSTAAGPTEPPAAPHARLRSMKAPNAAMNFVRKVRVSSRVRVPSAPMMLPILPI